MALRFDNGADYLKTLVEPARPFSVMGWAKFSVDTNSYTAICMYDHGDPGTNDGAQGGVATDSGGLDPGFWDGAGFHDNTAISVGTWFFWAFTINATGTGAVTFHLRTSPTATISTFSGWSMNSDTQDRLLVGNDSWTSALNGCVDCIKVYDSVLTAAQIDQESRVRVPVFGPAHIWSPMIDNSVASAALDYSGNGRNWTIGGTLAVEDGAPIPWGAPPIIVSSAASGSSVLDAAATGNIGGVNGTAVAGGVANAVASGSIGGVNGTAVGHGLANAIASESIGGVNGTAAGSLVTDSACSGSIGGLTGTAVASGIASAVAAGTIGGVNGAAVGHGYANAAAASNVGGLVGTANAAVAEPDIAAQGTIGGLDGTAVAHGYANASASGTIGGLNGAASANGTASAAASGSVGGVNGTGAAQLLLDGAAAGSIGGVNGTAVGHGYSSASCSGTAGGLAGTIAASAYARAAAAGTIGGLVGSASAEGGENVADTTIVIVDKAKATATGDTTVVIVDKPPVEEDDADTTIIVQTERDDT